MAGTRSRRQEAVPPLQVGMQQVLRRLARHCCSSSGHARLSHEQLSPDLGSHPPARLPVSTSATSQKLENITNSRSLPCNQVLTACPSTCSKLQTTHCNLQGSLESGPCCFPDLFSYHCFPTSLFPNPTLGTSIRSSLLQESFHLCSSYR